VIKRDHASAASGGGITKDRGACHARRDLFEQFGLPAEPKDGGPELGARYRSPRHTRIDLLGARRERPRGCRAAERG